MNTAVIYARVSSKDQEREGFSIPAQLKFNREYATKNGFQILERICRNRDCEEGGQKTVWGNGALSGKVNRSCRIVIAEKTDRLYRNLRDPFDAGRLRHRNSPSQRQSGDQQRGAVPDSADARISHSDGAQLR